MPSPRWWLDRRIPWMRLLLRYRIGGKSCMEGLEWRELLSGLGTRIGGGSEGVCFQRAFGSHENFTVLNLKGFSSHYHPSNQAFCG